MALERRGTTGHEIEHDWARERIRARERMQAERWLSTHTRADTRADMGRTGKAADTIVHANTDGQRYVKRYGHAMTPDPPSVLPHYVCCSPNPIQSDPVPDYPPRYQPHKR